jgi:hypothetical protein
LRKQTHARPPAPRLSSPVRSAVEIDFAWLLRERAEVQSIVVPLAAALEEVNAAGSARRTFLEQFSSTPAPEPHLASVGPLDDTLKSEIAAKGLDESEVRNWLAKGLELREKLAAFRQVQPHVAARTWNAGAYRHALTTMAKRDRLARMDLAMRAEREALASAAAREVVAPRARLAAAAGAFMREILRDVRPETFAARYAAERLSAMFTERCGRPHAGLIAALLKNAGLLGGHAVCWNSMVPAPCARMLTLERKKNRRRRERVRAARRCPERRCALVTERVEKMLRQAERK